MFDKRIVAIHGVNDRTFSVRRLVWYIRIMKCLGYKFISVNEILKKECPRKAVALTVDDAYKSCMVNLIPILEKYHIPALMFVPVGLLGLPANHPNLLKYECYKDEATMCADDVNVWLNKGLDIGFHTMKHIDLYSQTDLEYIQEDFKKGMDIMKKNGWNTDYFAYPKGFLPKDRDHFESLLRQQGIKYAFTINWGTVSTDKPFYVNRVCLGNHEYMFWAILKSLGILDYYFKKKRMSKAQVI